MFTSCSSETPNRLLSLLMTSSYACTFADKLANCLCNGYVCVIYFIETVNQNLPLRLLSFTISIAANYSGLTAIPATGLVSSTLCLSLSARLTCSTYMTTMEPPWGWECRFGTFSKPRNSHLLGAYIRFSPLESWKRIVLNNQYQTFLLHLKQCKFTYHTGYLITGFCVGTRQFEQALLLSPGRKMDATHDEVYSDFSFFPYSYSYSHFC